MQIHLTEQKYFVNLMAARFMGDPDHLHIGYENEPNVKIGEEVEVFVGEKRMVGVVAKIQPPTERLPAKAQAAQESGAAELSAQFRKEFGIDPSTFPKDEYFEDNLRAQWYLILRHKEG